MEGSVVLISVHPGYAEKILSGEKRLEFRRRWAARQVSRLVIYVTSPVQQIVAIAHVEEVHRGCKSHLWELAKNKGGGISRRMLFEYMEGRQEGVALELAQLAKFDDGGMNPSLIFGKNFRPPQSFRYLNSSEVRKLDARLRGK